MSKLIAVFNITAGAASIVGLLVTLNSPRQHESMLAIFGLALVFCVYVLFVPGNRIERNVESKLQSFRGASGERSTLQRGAFSIRETGPVSVQFPIPFAEVPTVKVTHKNGSQGTLPHIVDVSAIHVQFALSTYKDSRPRAFEWVAHGKTLEPIVDASAI